MTTEISKKKMDSFFENLAFELGLDPNEGALPFTSGGLDGVPERGKGAAK